MRSLLIGAEKGESRKARERNDFLEKLWREVNENQGTEFPRMQSSEMKLEAGALFLETR